VSWSVVVQNCDGIIAVFGLLGEFGGRVVIGRTEIPVVSLQRVAELANGALLRNL
jgi:hypothetical protein